MTATDPFSQMHAVSMASPAGKSRWSRAISLKEFLQLWWTFAHR
jgi:hypothetical protein